MAWVGDVLRGKSWSGIAPALRGGASSAVACLAYLLAVSACGESEPHAMTGDTSKPALGSTPPTSAPPVSTAGSAAPPASGSAPPPATGGAAGTAAGAGGNAGSTAGSAGCAQGPCAQPDAGASDAATMPEADAATAGPDAGSEPMPDPRFLVAATGPCPELRAGYATFMPDGVERRVLLYMSDAARTLDGPLVFSWHSTLPGPETSTSWLGTGVIDEIEAQGGIVAAPATRDSRTTRPWDNTALGPSGDNDQRLMDEVVACAREKVGIDVRRIHAIGMSAGGLKTAQVSLRRSGYLASVVVYSGGLTPDENPPDQDPNNELAAMILYGGATDISPVDGIPYTQASTKYRDLLRGQGRFAFLCNHGGGHSVPRDSQASAWAFMQAHEYGTPSPYASGLPAGFLRYCSLAP